MRRELWMCAMAGAVLGAAAGCRESAEDRAQRAQARASEEAIVRQSETVHRVATPGDSGRVLYDAPSNLSVANARRTGATIVGLDTATQPLEPAHHSGPPSGSAKP